MVDILIIGKGWSGNYICQLASKSHITYAATTRDGRQDTIPFSFHDSCTPKEFTKLPNAVSICITFPLLKKDQVTLFINLYESTHSSKPKYVLLGSTRPWSTPTPEKAPWIDVYDNIDVNADPLRSAAEEQLLGLGGCVLNLSGLWGGERQPRNWLDRIAPTKDALESKDSLHLIHGVDVARAVLSVSKDFTPGQRWILTDQRVYDWYDLVGAWGNENQRVWVQEIIKTKGLKGLPRTPNQLNRALNSNHFWNRFGIYPLYSLFSS